MSNVRISGPMLSIPNQVVGEDRHQQFWKQVEAATRDLRANSLDWDEELAERRAWDVTLSDGLEDECARNPTPE